MIDTLKHQVLIRNPLPTSSISWPETHRVQSNLVHDRDASLLAVLLQLLHGRRDVRRRHDILLGPNGALDHLGVEGVRDEGDDQVDLRELLVESGIIAHVEGDGICVLEARGELFGAFQCSTGYVRCRQQRDLFRSFPSHRVWHSTQPTP
jgi:hypothetical protein